MKKEELVNSWIIHEDTVARNLKFEVQANHNFIFTIEFTVHYGNEANKLLNGHKRNKRVLD